MSKSENFIFSLCRHSRSTLQQMERQNHKDFPSHFFFNIDVLSSGANLIILVQFNEVLLFDSCFDEGQNYRQTAIRSVTNFYFSVIQWRWRGVEVTRPIIGILIFCFDGVKTQENCFEGPK